MPPAARSTQKQASKHGQKRRQKHSEAQKHLNPGLSASCFSPLKGRSKRSAPAPGGQENQQQTPTGSRSRPTSTRLPAPARPLSRYCDQPQRIDQKPALAPGADDG